MDQNQEQLRQDQRVNEATQSTNAAASLNKQAGYEAQAEQQGQQAQQVAGAEQARFNAFDPDAYARQQTDAAGAMQAYQARRMGANAGKSARLGNFGLQQAQANAVGQGMGLKSQMGQSAYGMRAGQQGQYAQQGAQRGSQNLGQLNTQLGFVGAQQNALGAQEQQRQAIANTVGNTATKIGSAIGSGGASLAVPTSAAEKGGDIPAGTTTLVGEKGAEIIVPHGDATVIPNNIYKELSEHGKKLMKEFMYSTDLKRKKA